MSETLAAERRDFDAVRARERCRRYRLRLLEVAQRVRPLHLAPALSCTEIVDLVYNELMKGGADLRGPDTFLLSKGHAAIIQYIVLEDLGVLLREDLERCCTDGGRLGVHPDRGTPGIAASTGSLGHGLSMALGMALAEKARSRGGTIYCALSDGELQEGSTWEAVLLASSLRASNLVVFVDANGWQSSPVPTRESHPSFEPLAEKFAAFGWETVEADGHDAADMAAKVLARSGTKPFVVVARTVKGKGITFMENAPRWHYHWLTPEEHARAVAELESAF